LIPNTNWQIRYFDVLVEYAKAELDDILIKITATNRGPETAHCHVLPTLWFRNTWSWGYDAGPMGDVSEKPRIKEINGLPGVTIVETDHPVAGKYYLYADLINGQTDAVNPDRKGTKAAVLYHEEILPGNSRIIRLRLSNTSHGSAFEDFDQIFKQRLAEADEFYAAVQKPGLNEDEKQIQRQALAGMLWSKQFFYYNVEQWLAGDPGMSTPSEARANGRNHGWEHLNNFDIISMPDKWEYPWY